MSNQLTRGIRRVMGSTRAVPDPGPEEQIDRQPVSVVTGSSFGFSSGAYYGSEDLAMRLSDVSRCVNILSDDMAKLPWFLMDSNSKERIYDKNLMGLLTVRPNEGMTPFQMEKFTEASVLTAGAGYIWILRNQKTLEPEELIPVPGSLVTPWRDTNGHVWYTVIHPYTKEPMKLDALDMIQILGYTRDNLHGVSVLEQASEVISARLSAQRYESAYYQNGGAVSGVLQTESDLGGNSKEVDSEGNPISKRDVIRNEWERIHAGPSNAHRIAVLDLGLKYTPLSISQKDAQFVESAGLHRIDIANAFGVPLYKLNDGKQAYDSNEQNNTDYVMTSLQPKVTNWEQEFTWKLLRDGQINKGLRLRKNMMAALRGDFTSRANWYKTMREIGPFSVNDILALEDMPAVPGGDVRQASLNFVPLEDFKELSKKRNGGKG